MSDVIVEIVDRVIVHATRLLDEGAYDWPTSRAALERILADLEARSLGHPGLERLRQFIGHAGDAWEPARARQNDAGEVEHSRSC